MSTWGIKDRLTFESDLCETTREPRNDGGYNRATERPNIALRRNFLK